MAEEKQYSVNMVKGETFLLSVLVTPVTCQNHRRSTTGLIFFFFFFLHFHPFGDPYDMFMQLFYL